MNRTQLRSLIKGIIEEATVTVGSFTAPGSVGQGSVTPADGTNSAIQPGCGKSKLAKRPKPITMVEAGTKAGKIKVGDKFGPFVITKYVPLTYGDKGEAIGGDVKLVDQEEAETQWIRHDQGVWGISFRNKRIEDKDLKKVLDKFLKEVDKVKKPKEEGFTPVPESEWAWNALDKFLSLVRAGKMDERIIDRGMEGIDEIKGLDWKGFDRFKKLVRKYRDKETGSDERRRLGEVICDEYEDASDMWYEWADSLDESEDEVA